MRSFTLLLLCFVGCAAWEETTGGAACTMNAECGFLPANANHLIIDKKKSASDLLSDNGECKNNVCVCTGNFGCASCSAQRAFGTTNKSALGGPVFDASRPTAKIIDMCVPNGGGSCRLHSECLNGGLCLKKAGSPSGVCGCYTGYTCPFCELSENSLLYGAKCPASNSNSSTSFLMGGAKCTDNNDCDGSLCVKGVCKCGESKGCPDCSKSIADLVDGSADCGCDNVYCGGDNGYCGGSGACVCHYPWVGPSCTTNPCNPENKGDICATKPNAQCVIDEKTRTASCECTGNFGKDSAGECTVPPKCTKDADCGVWAPIERPGLPSRYEFCNNIDSNKCGDGTDNFIGDGVSTGNFGGVCDTSTGTCTCKEGVTCAACDAKGDPNTDCTAPGAMVTGGGLCTSDVDCQKLGGGNFCVNRRCVCANGFTCAYCDVIGQNSINQPNLCPKRSEEAALKPTPPPTPVPPTPPPTPPTPVPTPRPTGKPLPGLNLGDPKITTAGSSGAAVRPKLAHAVAGLLSIALLCGL